MRDHESLVTPYKTETIVVLKVYIFILRFWRMLPPSNTACISTNRPDCTSEIYNLNNYSETGTYMYRIPVSDRSTISCTWATQSKFWKQEQLTPSWFKTTKHGGHNSTSFSAKKPPRKFMWTSGAWIYILNSFQQHSFRV